MDREAQVNLIEEDPNGYVTLEGQRLAAGYLNDIVVGYEDEDEGVGRLIMTEDAYKEVADVLDPKAINGDPYGTGQRARQLVVEASEFYHNNDGEFIKLDLQDGEFTYDTIDEETHSELVGSILDEYERSK